MKDDTKIVICFIPAVLLLMIGLHFVILGFAERGDAESTYVVGFQRAGELCQSYPVAAGSPDQMVLDVESGRSLSCGPSKAASPAETTPRPLPGFSEAQRDDVLALAESLGRTDGPLTDADKRQIQQRVNEIVALIPPTAQPYYGHALWGSRRIAVGIAMLLAAILLLIFLYVSPDQVGDS